MRRLSVLIAAGLAGLPALAAEPALRLPLDCAPGETCWIANYVDVDPGPGAQDFRCRPRSYDGHKGVDFAIRDQAEMRRGVEVRAAAAGVVTALRDFMPDRLSPGKDAAGIAGRECGNGVIVAHDDGWETQYCHMRQGSVRVRKGERVAAGAALGLVGLSGNTEFPHLHLTVRHGDAVIDPFTGRPMSAGCGAEGRPLWAEPIAYEGFALYNAGLSGQVPDAAAIRAGEREPESLPRDVPALVLWADMFGVAAGDRLTFRITGPDGGVFFEETLPVDRTQARRFVYAGRKRPAEGLQAGAYTGTVTLARPSDDGPGSRTVSRSVTVE